MMISTKGRYALRVMVDLAEHRQEGYIPLRTVALRQGISQKYLESIMTTLSKAGFVDGTHGRGGGYRLWEGLDQVIRDYLDNVTLAQLMVEEKGESD